MLILDHFHNEAEALKGTDRLTTFSPDYLIELDGEISALLDLLSRANTAFLMYSQSHKTPRRTDLIDEINNLLNELVSDREGD